MILQALKGYYDRVAGDPCMPRFGYGLAPISFAIILRPDGTIVDVNDLREKEAGKSRPAELLVPKDFEDRTSGDAAPRAFWDKVEYVFGVSQNQERAARRFQNFRDRHVSIFGDTDDVGLRSILIFLACWTPNRFADLRYSSEMLAESNIVFRLDGEQEFIHERLAAETAWERTLHSGEAGATQCLATGAIAKSARLHPLIKNIARAGEPTPKLVSFDKDTDAFDSLGKKQGDNAPVSEQAAFAYTTALNDLLRKGSRQRVRIGDATTVYWAEATDPKQAEVAEQAVSWLFEPPSLEQQDVAETDRLRKEVMDRVASGRPLEDPELKLAVGTHFYVLGLSPNAARLSVRFWEATTLGAIGKAFHRHWQDMRMDQSPARGQPPSVARCALMTAPARNNKAGQTKFNFDDVSPLLSGELMRAILTGGRYPAALLANLTMRIRTDRHINRLRISLIKATIVRAMRADGKLPTEDYLVRTDPNDPNPARRLGRLFAVLERAQLAALGDNVNATIKDKFIGSAAATPAQVFTFLVKNSQHHTARLRRGHADAGWIRDAQHARRVGMALERDIGQLWGSFHEGLPMQLSTNGQGLFFVGYYQERFGGKADAEVGDGPATDHTDIEE